MIVTLLYRRMKTNILNSTCDFFYFPLPLYWAVTQTLRKCMGVKRYDSNYQLWKTAYKIDKLRRHSMKLFSRKFLQNTGNPGFFCVYDLYLSIKKLTITKLCSVKMKKDS